MGVMSHFQQKTNKHKNKSLSSFKMVMVALLGMLMITENTMFVQANQTSHRFLEDADPTADPATDDTTDPNLDESANQIIDGADLTDNSPEAAAAAALTPVPTVDNTDNDKKGAEKAKARTKANVAKTDLNDFEIEDLQARYKKGEYQLSISSITPRGGPITGGTRVLVRMSDLAPFVDAYPAPKCKFGKNKMTVLAAYVKCTKAPGGFFEKEKKSLNPMDSTCVQCESSPIADIQEVISFTVSLTGNFDDASSSMPYRYYNALKVHAINPRYGPKDGDTVVQVWGENFLDLGDDFRCNFGTKSTKAHFINSGQLWCRAAVSDVVNRPMPFSISLNRQQNSREKLEYWYYNMQNMFRLEPDFGSMAGDQKITIKGQSFMPWDWSNDIDNQNDTFCSFGHLGKTPAHAVSGTDVECLTPSNPGKIDQVPVKLTINNQNYTDELVMFTFFNPPNVIDARPLFGPVKGGTQVDIWGSSFEKKNITCMFGKYETKGKFISKEHIACVSPQVPEPGDVKLTIKYSKDRFSSDTFTYRYYADPVVGSIYPTCGPIEGFTQFKVTGKNFVEQGWGKAKCVFNGTIMMNATVIDSTTLYCDSPPLESNEGTLFYNVSVTLDGGDFISNASAEFRYYVQPKISSITPGMGPTEGGTVSTVIGKGFKHPNICDFKARYEQTHVEVNNLTDTSFIVSSPAANLTGAVLVSISGNNQQFINDITIHYRDQQNTFEYVQPFLIESIAPESLSNAGNTPLSLKALNFDQFRWDNNTVKNVPLYCRFVKDQDEISVIGNETKMTKISGMEQQCVGPKSNYEGDSKVQLSVNGQQWQDAGYKVKFYPGPRVTAVSPTYGVTKNPKGLSITISGENFDCPNSDCTKIKVRFQNERGDWIFEEGAKISNTITAKIPKYPAPETLDVDVSMNGVDFTNDHVKYGFMDPYVIDIQPRLISPKGTTTVNMTGYGFVNMEDANKSVVNYQANNKDMLCKDNAVCQNTYKVINEHQSTVGTKDQAQVNKLGKNIGFDPWGIAMMNPDGDFTPNGINLWYYTEPTFANASATFAYSNEEKPILIATDFKWGQGANTFARFRKHAQITCRFSTQTEQVTSVVVPAIMEVSPIGAYHGSEAPNQIRCRTPKWNNTDTVLLEISINGLDYMGNFQISFVEQLTAFRISPLAGPLDGSTTVKVYGYGMTSAVPKDTLVYVRFGTQDVQVLDKSKVNEQDKWSESAYHEELNLPKNLLLTAEENDTPILEEQGIRSYLGAIAPDISKMFTFDKPDVKGMGGPVYVQLSEKVPIQTIDHGSKKKGEITDQIETIYSDSSNLEYFFYRKPFVKKVEPNSGLATGGTVLTITGGWFMQMPQYGVYPFCKIGGTVVRGKYVTSNRILCKTPPSVDFATPSSIGVSLNGVDFHDTPFQFSYYEKPILMDVQPRSGSVEGGTEIWLKGTKFSNITSGMKSVKCRFRQIVEGLDADDDSVPSKFIPAYYIDNTTMKCATPAGWQGGDQTRVDLTFNGVDYTDSSYVFNFYNIFGSFPKSGPADATNQYIQIRGKGFRVNSTILCSLNGTEVGPLQVKFDVIKCPMVLPNWPADKYEAVPFSIVIDGSRRDFGNFVYYQQIEVESVDPLLGPNEGHGAIYFIGKNFRSDFENSRLGCRIGNTLQTAALIDAQTIRCTINKKLPLVDEGQSLPVSISLNSYSWAQVASEYSFQPYGIIDMYPTSGPVGENTNVIVVGKGFVNDLQESARCKFGTEDNYQIVEAQVLDDEHLICKSPSQDLALPDGASEEINVPFSIAFQEDLYYPYTEGIQKFRMYNHPVTTELEPDRSSLTRLTEVYVYADEEQGFRQPIPSAGRNYIEEDAYGLKCKFGRFGSSTGQYINRTTILCLTPNIIEDPAEVSEETVTVSVALNGIDFNDDYSSCQFTFVGTGGNVSSWVIIMGTLIFGLLIVAILIFLSGLQEFMKVRKQENNLQSYTHKNETGGLAPRGGSRAGSSVSRQRNLSRAAGASVSRAGGSLSRGQGGGSRAGGSRQNGRSSQQNNNYGGFQNTLAQRSNVNQ